MTNSNYLIDVSDLHKSFGELQVLKGVSEHISKGEVVSIIGPSGGGKSTFLRCLNLLETPTKGTITFEGTDITDPKTDINLVRRQMGMVFQHFNLFPNMTVLKNLTLAPRKLKGMTQQAMAERLGISLRYYQQIESGDRTGDFQIWDDLEDITETHQRILRAINPGKADNR